MPFVQAPTVPTYLADGSTLETTELNDGRSASLTADGFRECTRAFDVMSSVGYTSPMVILRANGLPKKNDPYVSADGMVDAEATVRTVEARLISESSNTWRVDVKYSTKFGPTTGKWSTFLNNKPMIKDLEGFDVLNSAFRPFDPPVEYSEAGLRLTISRRQTWFLPTFYLNFIDTVNLDPFFGFGPGHVRCADISADTEYEDAVEGWRVTYIFEFMVIRGLENPLETWQARVLDAGYETFDAGTQEWTPIRFNARALSSPTRLDGVSGQQLPPEDPSQYLVFTRRYGEIFADLNLE